MCILFLYCTSLYDCVVASFVPPDVPADDSIINTPSTSCIDIDEDELHWQEWLADLMNPSMCLMIIFINKYF